MTPDELVDHAERGLTGTLVVVASEENGAPEVAWGDMFLIYDPERVIPPEKHFPYATVVVNDYPGFDEFSDLAREGVYRVNIWVSKDTFDAETPDEDPATIDYTVFDRIIPHPVYGSQSWLSVVNPGPATEERVRALLAEAHDRARARYEKQHSQAGEPATSRSDDPDS
jgi:hypothetical protein